MKKQVFRLSSFLLAMVLLLPFIPALGANAAGMTQTQAVAWAKAKIGQSINYDGQWGCQCVDLIQAYYDQFGYRNYAGGNAVDFITKSLPGGWTRVTYNGTSSAKPGDIAVWKANNKYYTSPGWYEVTGANGHIGIVTEVTSSGITIVEQNPSDSVVKVKSVTYSADCCSQMLSCLIRPAYGTSSGSDSAPILMEKASSFNELKEYVNDTDALLIHKFTVNTGASISKLEKVGIELMSADGTVLKKIEEVPDRSYSTVYVYYYINGELKVTLTPATKYQYRFFAKYDGKVYNGTTYSFTTTGYSITYDANGGTGAPSAQYVGAGKSTTISKTVPTFSGYTFKGWATSKSAATATYQPGASVTFTSGSAITLYAVWEKNAATLTSIEIQTPPKKTIYTVGESFDASGLTLKARYSDGSTTVITDGFTVEGFSSAAAGNKTVTVTYKGMKAEFQVQVVQAENAPKIAVVTKTARAGDIVTVQLRMANVPSAISMMMTDFTYDKNALEYVSGRWTVENAAISNWSIEQGAVLAFTENTNINGVIFELTFRVKEGAVSGFYGIGFTAQVKRNVDGSEVPMDVSVVSGGIEVTDVRRGDLNEDEQIDSADAIYLLWYTFLSDQYPVGQNADFNGDRKIDSADAIYLLWYTFLPDQYPID